MLCSSEWLSQAKKLPIGQTTRVFHGAERRPNLVVRNTETSWSAYCHSCHDGGTVRKEHVKVLPKATPIKRKAGDPGFLRSINLDVSDPNIPFSDIIMFLHSKNMTLQYIQHLNPRWSAQDKRIVLETKEQMLGRDITNLSHSKWYKYSGVVPYVKAKDIPTEGKTVVLTEDLFSACKGQYYTSDNVVFIALVGTRISDSLLVELTKVKRVVMLLDGDDAGDEGSQVITRTLRLIGVPYEVVRVPQDLDPKDMLPQWWCDFSIKMEKQNA